MDDRIVLVGRDVHRVVVVIVRHCPSPSPRWSPPPPPTGRQATPPTTPPTPSPTTVPASHLPSPSSIVSDSQHHHRISGIFKRYLFRGKPRENPHHMRRATGTGDGGGGDDGGDSCCGVAPLVGIRDSETSTTSPACAFASCSSQNHASYPPPPMQGCGATRRVCSSCLDRPS
jgi:hypothetical protein